MPRLFCTLFDTNYAARGLALYRSLERHSREDFVLAILCMDDEVARLLSKLPMPRARLLRVDDLGDPDLLRVRSERPAREFCWTCAPALMRALLLNDVADGEIVTYVDADLLFFADPAPVFAEMGDRDILIHEHRFGPSRQHLAEWSGIFNVGLVSIRRSPQGLACVERWRAQCIECCELDADRRLCGDQKYLDEWPALYDRLVILQHKGAALAPWNIENYRITPAGRGGGVLVDGQPLIFYHFHALRVMSYRRFGFCWVLPSVGYDFTPVAQRLIYRPYAAALRAAARELRRASASLKAETETPPLRELRSQYLRGRLAFG
jgi:hypothetical protein